MCSLTGMMLTCMQARGRAYWAASPVVLDGVVRPAWEEFGNRYEEKKERDG